MQPSQFLDLVNQNPINRALFDRLPDLALADCWLVSGALFQTAWNVITSRSPTNGILDYDIFYFDEHDVSWEAEDECIQRVTRACADLNVRVEVRNQARVHLWYPAKFGAPYPRLEKPTDSIDRFLAKACMVGLSANHETRHHLYAPAGLDDIAELVLRPNPSPNFQAHRYLEKASRWSCHWPELTIIPPPT